MHDDDVISTPAVHEEVISIADVVSQQPAPGVPAVEGRYRVETDDERRFVVGLGSPDVRLVIQGGITVTAKSLRSVERQTIFLDGAFGGPPFHDTEKRIYSFDHHEGCIRSMTLATCEQAAVALVLGLPIGEGRWTVVINEPDLDSVLGAWVLMNHIDILKNEASLLWSIMPLLKTESNIDSYGFGREVLTGLSRDAFAAEQARLDVLMAPIRERKNDGLWQPADYETVVLSILDSIDRMVLPAETIAQSLEFRELGRTILRGRRLAILCASTRGIYEVEEHLVGRYGKQVAVVVLDQGQGRFTVRRTDGFGIPPLRKLFRALNRTDPAVTGSSAGENQWGGADDIGGSPRETGTGLSGRQILDQIERLYGEPRSLWGRFKGLFGD